MMRRLGFLLMAVLLLAMAACAGDTTETAAPPAPQTAAVDTMTEDADMDDGQESTESMDEAPHDVMADDDMAADESMADDTMADDTMADESTADESMSDDMMAQDTVALAAWQTLPLTNARTGETFTLGDYAGQTVFVEPMATWCSNCRQQLTNVQQARVQLSSDDVVFIALSVETTISNEELARYADDLGFDWTFAVMTPELLQALAEQFGRTVSNPPSTPHFVIRADGSASELVTGIQSAEEIAALTAN